MWLLERAEISQNQTRMRGTREGWGATGPHISLSNPDQMQRRAHEMCFLVFPLDLRTDRRRTHNLAFSANMDMEIGALSKLCRLFKKRHGANLARKRGRSCSARRVFGGVTARLLGIRDGQPPREQEKIGSRGTRLDVCSHAPDSVESSLEEQHIRRSTNARNAWTLASSCCARTFTSGLALSQRLENMIARTP